MKDKLISTPWGKAVKILTFNSKTKKTIKHVSKKRYKELINDKKMENQGKKG